MRMVGAVALVMTIVSVGAAAENDDNILDLPLVGCDTLFVRLVWPPGEHLTVREAPNYAAGKVGELVNDDPVKICAYVDGWSKIVVPHVEGEPVYGWVPARLLGNPHVFVPPMVLPQWRSPWSGRRLGTAPATTR